MSQKEQKQERQKLKPASSDWRNRERGREAERGAREKEQEKGTVEEKTQHGDRSL